MSHDLCQAKIKFAASTRRDYNRIVSFSPFVRRLFPILLLLFVIACANVPAPRQQAVLPLPPTYAPTAFPVATPSLESITPPSSPGGSTVGVAPAEPTPTLLLPTRPPITVTAPKHNLSALNEYQRGIAYVAIDRNEYHSAASQRALDELFATGANYLSLLVTWYQADVGATNIYRADNTPSDDELAYVVEYAHAHGVKVMLKPQLDFSNDPDHWRGEIQFETQADWTSWFASYQEFILHYAEFAQQNGVEEFSVGTELVGTTKRAADWRAVIHAVRGVYSGLLTYSANHSGEEVQVQFWNALDFIGVNVFYHITNYRTPTMAQILEGWQLPVRQLTNLHNSFPKQPIIFTEVGYPSMDLASVWPWNWNRTAALDIQEQAMLYQGLFQTWWHNPDHTWFRGMFIWNWTADPNQGGMEDSGYTPHAKPAEDILRHYYQQVTE